MLGLKPLPIDIETILTSLIMYLNVVAVATYYLLPIYRVAYVSIEF